jgi:hypothetical protein
VKNFNTKNARESLFSVEHRLKSIQDQYDDCDLIDKSVAGLGSREMVDAMEHVSAALIMTRFAFENLNDVATKYGQPETVEDFRPGDKVSFVVVAVDQCDSGRVLTLRYNDDPNAGPIYLRADDAELVKCNQ